MELCLKVYARLSANEATSVPIIQELDLESTGNRDASHVETARRQWIRRSQRHRRMILSNSISLRNAHQTLDHILPCA
jgi:hypothetical protein